MGKILIIDDEKSIRRTLKEILEFQKYQIEEAQDGMEALNLLRTNHFDLVLCDIKMPKMDGIEILEKICAMDADIPVVMISGHGTIDNAVEAVKKGAFDFIAKPLDLNRLLVTIKNALDKAVLVKETKVLKKKVGKTSEMVGVSQGIAYIKELIDKVAPTDARVLICLLYTSDAADE